MAVPVVRRLPIAVDRRCGDDEDRRERRGTLVRVFALRFRHAFARATTAAFVTGLALAGCGDDGPSSDAGRFCAEATEHRDTIVAPPLGNESEVDATLEFYRLMGQLAPLAIAEEWADLVAVLETANTVVAGDPASEQQVALQAYASERSAYEVATWLGRNCGLDLPIITIAPQDPPPVVGPTAATPGTTPNSVPTSAPGG
jgi:hypothetical protein